MSPEDQAFCRQVAETLNEALVRPIAASILYGASVGLMAYASGLFYKRRLRGQSAWIMVSAAPVCFLLTTVNFGGSIAWINNLFNELSRYRPSLPPSSVLRSTTSRVASEVYMVTQYFTMVISDAIVTWRTQALYPDRPHLYRLPATILVASISCFFIGFCLERKTPNWPTWTARSPGRTVDDIAQSLSLLMNVITTILVGIRFWSHRRWFRNHRNGRTRLTDIQTRVLLLFETGVLFCIVQMIAVAFTLSVDFLALNGIPCTGACIYTPFATSRFRFAFAANYSIIVLVLVHNKSSVAEIQREPWSTVGGTDVIATSQPDTIQDAEVVELRPLNKLSLPRSERAPSQ